MDSSNQKEDDSLPKLSKYRAMDCLELGVPTFLYDAILKLKKGVITYETV